MCQIFPRKISVKIIFVGHGNPQKLNAQNVPCRQIFMHLLFLVGLPHKNILTTENFPNYSVWYPQREIHVFRILLDNRGMHKLIPDSAHGQVSILCSRSLEARLSFYNSRAKHDVETKRTLIDFSRRVAEGSRSSQLQTLGNQLIDPSPIH